MGAVAALVVLGAAARAHAAPQGAPPPARVAPANEAEAARLFREGEAAYTSGDYTRAAERFERANALAPHHGVLWNAARSWLKAGDDVRAANLLEQFLKAAPDEAAERDQATASLAKLRKKLGAVEVRGDDVHDIRVDDTVVVGSLHYVAPGEHIATAVAGGKPVRRVFTVGAGERTALLLSGSAAPAALPPSTDAPLPPKPRGDRETERAPPASSGLSPWFVAVGGGLTLAGVVATVASGLDANSQQARFDSLDADQTSTLAARGEAFDATRDAGRRTNVILGVTAAVAVATAVTAVFFVDWRGATTRRDAATIRDPYPGRLRLGVGPFGFVSISGVLP